MAKIKSALKSIRYYFHYLIKAADEHHILLLASGLSFSVLTCIIPLVLILFSILGTILNQPQIEREIGLYIDRIIPYSEEAGFVKQLIMERAEDFKIYGSAAGFIGAIGMVFMSSGLFGSMRTILNRLFKVARNKPIWSGKLKDIGLLLLVILYFLISVTILPTSEALFESAKKVQVLSFLKFGFVSNFLLATVSLTVAFISFFVVYWMLPQRKLPKRVILFSAAVAAILWHIANQLFGFYISHAFTLKNVYGAYSLIVIIAIWIYYTSVVFITGATLGQAFREKHYAPPK